VPLDGEIIEGSSQLDTSALTGESVPRTVNVGETVLAGTINQTGVLTVTVTKLFGESSIARILDLVENASAKKAETEKFITKFARRYTPIAEIAAHGIQAMIEGKLVLAGNDRLMHREKIVHDTCNVEGTVVHLAIDRRVRMRRSKLRMSY
jgi:cation transport ATPase